MLGELGQGSSGLVYEALDLDLGRRVALKVLAPESGGNAEGFERFRREARTVAQLEHENIVTVYDFGKAEDGRAYFSMEMLRGDGLDQLLLRNGAFEWRSAVTLSIQACRALEAAHEAGIVHRDIKPANLFVTRTGQLKLLDFGIAHLKQQAEPTERDSEAFIIVGTPEYMAPEQATGAEPTASSDVYALGSVLYEMSTGERPFCADNIAALIDIKSTQQSDTCPQTQQKPPDPQSDRSNSIPSPVGPCAAQVRISSGAANCLGIRAGRFRSHGATPLAQSYATRFTSYPRQSRVGRRIVGFTYFASQWASLGRTGPYIKPSCPIVCHSSRSPPRRCVTTRNRCWRHSVIIEH